MEYTQHTFLVGDDGLSLSLSFPPSRLSLLTSLIIKFITCHTATAFAVQMGFPKEDLHTDYSWYVPPLT